MGFISDLLIEITSFRIRVGNKLNKLWGDIGNKATLTTTDKSNLVNAVNEVNSKHTDFGGVNLVGDSHFYNGDVNGWSSLYGTQLVENHIYKKTFTTLSGAARIERVFPNLKAGVYTLTIYVKTTVDIEWKAFVGSTVNIVSQSSPNTFARRSVTFSVPNDGNVTVRGYVPNIPVGSVIEIDWFKLETGYVGSDWTPTLEEQKSDWNETNPFKDSYIKNKPEIPNVTGFIPYTGANQPVNLNTQSFSIGGDFEKMRATFEKSYLSNSISSSAHFTRLTDVASFSKSSDNTTQTDCIVITLPIRTSTRWLMEVDIFTSATVNIFGGTPTKLLISAYGVNNIIGSVTAISNADNVKSVSFCRDSNDNTVIVIRPIDDATRTFGYGKVNIANFYHSVTYNSDLADKSNYKVEAVLESSLAGLTTNGTTTNAQFTRDSYLWNQGNFNPAQYVLQTDLNTQLANYVPINGVTTINNTKTFTSSPVVPNATLDSHAVNLGQLNSAISGIATPTLQQVLNSGNEAIGSHVYLKSSGNQNSTYFWEYTRPSSGGWARNGFTFRVYAPDGTTEEKRVSIGATGGYAFIGPTYNTGTSIRWYDGDNEGVLRINTRRIPLSVNGTFADVNGNINVTDTTYSAGTGLSLSGTTFGQTITTSGTGTFVTGITQTTNGFQVNLGTPPNTTYSAGTLALLQAGTNTSNRVWSPKILADGVIRKGVHNVNPEGEPFSIEANNGRLTLDEWGRFRFEEFGDQDCFFEFRHDEGPGLVVGHNHIDYEGTLAMGHLRFYGNGVVNTLSHNLSGYSRTKLPVTGTATERTLAVGATMGGNTYYANDNGLISLPNIVPPSVNTTVKAYMPGDVFNNDTIHCSAFKTIIYLSPTFTGPLHIDIEPDLQDGSELIVIHTYEGSGPSLFNINGEFISHVGQFISTYPASQSKTYRFVHVKDLERFALVDVGQI